MTEVLLFTDENGIPIRWEPSETMRRIEELAATLHRECGSLQQVLGEIQTPGRKEMRQWP